MITYNDNRGTGDVELKGLSTDTKPTEGIAVNSLFVELDTLDIYYFDGENWQKAGATE